jgi:H+/Cl- antiporter ClcA
MGSHRRLIDRLRGRIDDQRVYLSRPEALLPMAGLGVLTGLAAGLVIVAFRLAIEVPQAAVLPGGDPENYEGLPPLLRLLLPVGGGLLIGLMFLTLARRETTVGVVHVMERLAYFQGQMTWRGLLLQFAGATMAIVSGNSVGREGPSVHLGAATGSLLGGHLALPNNSIRTLVGCGTAAAIAASFNTPLAGVIFALEVVMMEYSLLSFTPVILAAVSATAVSILFFGSDPAFVVPPLELGSLMELPLVLVLGIVCGGAAAAFIHLVRLIATRTGSVPFWIRAPVAGLVTGLCALAIPQVMGIGYDTVNASLIGDLTLGTLAGIALFKLIATAGAIGLGLPGGLIGPTLVIGACLGGATALIAGQWLPELSPHPGLYALLGMGAMMAGTLQAPLAALMAIFELTANPGIILPGMLAVVTAALACSEGFRGQSVFLMLLQARGLDYRNDPITQALRRAGVASVMDRSFVQVPARLSSQEARRALADNPRWLLIPREELPAMLMPSIDLARHLETRKTATEEAEGEEPIDLLDIPADRCEAAAVHLRATLQEAMQELVRNQVDALYVERLTAPGIRRIYGILTREGIEHTYAP